MMRPVRLVRINYELDKTIPGLWHCVNAYKIIFPLMLNWYLNKVLKDYKIQRIRFYVL